MVRFALAALSCCVAASADAQELTLKLRRAALPGKGASVTEQFSQSSVVTVRDADGKVVREQRTALGKDELFFEAVLAAGEPYPARFARKYEKAVRMRDGKPTPAAHQGRDIVFEKRDQCYAAEAVGADSPLAAADLKALGADVTADVRKDPREALLRKTPVKEGAAWTVAPADLAAAFVPEAIVESAGGDCELKLSKVYEKDGVRFGVIEANLKLSVTAVKNLKFDAPVPADVRISLDTAIDGKGVAGKMTAQVKYAGKSTVEMMGKKVTVELAVDRTVKTERSAEKSAQPAAAK